MLKHLTQRIKYYLQVLLDLRNHANERRSLAYINRNKTIENQLSLIGSGAELDPEELSYSFPAVCRRMQLDLRKAKVPSRIALCSVALGERYAEIVEPCLRSQAEYCAAQGYDYALLKSAPGSQSRPPAWYKVPLVYKLMQAGYDYVAFIDADAMVTNPHISIEPFCAMLRKEEKVLYLAEDERCPNTGVFFVRNCPDAVRLLDLLWMHDFGDHLLWEQDALHYLLDSQPQIRRIVKIADSGSLFNSFPVERETLIRSRPRQQNSWKKGDFICHFSGLRGPVLERLIGEYTQKIS